MTTFANFKHDKENHFRAIGIDANTEEQLSENIHNNIKEIDDLQNFSKIIEKILLQVKKEEFGEAFEQLTEYEIKLFATGLLFQEIVKDKTFELIIKNLLGGFNNED
jgi:hypothetical protein